MFSWMIVQPGCNKQWIC